MVCFSDTFDSGFETPISRSLLTVAEDIHLPFQKIPSVLNFIPLNF